MCSYVYGRSEMGCSDYFRILSEEERVRERMKLKEKVFLNFFIHKRFLSDVHWAHPGILSPFLLSSTSSSSFLLSLFPPPFYIFSLLFSFSAFLFSDSPFTLSLPFNHISLPITFLLLTYITKLILSLFSSLYYFTPSSVAILSFSCLSLFTLPFSCFFPHPSSFSPSLSPSLTLLLSSTEQQIEYERLGKLPLDKLVEALAEDRQVIFLSLSLSYTYSLLDGQISPWNSFCPSLFLSTHLSNHIPPLIYLSLSSLPHSLFSPLFRKRSYSTQPLRSSHTTSFGSASLQRVVCVCMRACVCVCMCLYACVCVFALSYAFGSVGERKREGERETRLIFCIIPSRPLLFLPSPLLSTFLFYLSLFLSLSPFTRTESMRLSPKFLDALDYQFGGVEGLQKKVSRFCFDLIFSPSPPSPLLFLSYFFSLLSFFLSSSPISHLCFHDQSLLPPVLFLSSFLSVYRSSR